MSVTYRDLPKEIDPIVHLFGDEKLTVPESYFTPERTIRFYERCLQAVEMKSLYNKGKKVDYGLQSLPSLLRFEPKSHREHPHWLHRKADRATIDSALPKGTSYQLQYLALFDLDFPGWKDIPMVSTGSVYNGPQVMGEVTTTALLYGKNQKLYFVTASWQPEKGYFKQETEPRYCTDPLVFQLSKLTVEVVDWQDARIKAQIEAGTWSDVKAFKGRLHFALEASANIHEGRARVLRKTADLFDIDGMPIYTGR